MKLHISPKELGRAVGVSESSLKRWADEGVLPASRTAGGHRRIAIDDAVKFIRRTGLALIEPKAIGLPELRTTTGAKAPNEAPHLALMKALADGDGPRVRGLLLGAYIAGRPLPALFDELVAPAMHELGKLWRHGADGIFIEHRATAICLEAINQLRPLIPSPDRRAPRAVGGALEGDVYAMPSLMAATILANEGWREMNLGPDTPAKTLLIAADAAEASVVWVSISVERAESELLRDLAMIADGLRPRGARLVVGGRGVPKSGLAGRPNVHVAQSMGELAAFAAGFVAAAPAA